MELIAYIRLFRKWFWLLFLGTFLAGGAAFLYRSRQPEQYQAHVMISVGGFMEAPNPSSSQINTGAELAQTYAVLAKTYEVLQAAIDAQGFPITPAALGSMIDAQVVSDTSLLRITVTYTDPVLAADMANEVAEQLILNSPSNLTPAQQDQIDLANAESERLVNELESLRLQLDTIDSQLATATDPAQIDQLRSQRNLIVGQINQVSGTIAQFTDIIASLQQRTNSLDIVERARIPTAPIGSSTLMTTILGAMVGAALAAGIALLVEYLGDTVKTPEEVAKVLSLPTLATITRFGKRNDGYSHRLIAYLDPGSPVSEEYRTLRTNLMFSSDKSTVKTAYVITSPVPGDGKSVTAANLAVTMAMAGWDVLLVDADMRRPKIHEILGLKNDIGLSTLLSADPGQVPSEEEESQILSQNLRPCLQETDIPRLRVITSGYIPLNPTEVLGATVMKHWFQEFRAARNVDIILFDTPPTLVVADSSVLASALKIPVLLVLQAGAVRYGAAQKAKEQFDHLGVEVAGVVLNAVNPKHRGYDYGYSGYYYYYRDAGSRSK